MGHFLVEVKIRTFKCPKRIFLASTSVPFRPTTVQTPNLTLIETKRITVWGVAKVTYVRQLGYFTLLRWQKVQAMHLYLLQNTLLLAFCYCLLRPTDLALGRPQKRQKSVES